MALVEVVGAAESLRRAEAAHDASLTGGMPVVDVNAKWVTQLDSYLASCWEAARDAKESGAQRTILEDLRQREGEYDPDKLQAIRSTKGSEIKMMLTSVKCRAAEGFLRDVVLPADERPYTVKPTPVPDLPADVKDGIYGMTMQAVDMAIAQGIYPTPQEVYQRARGVYDEQLRALVEEAKVRASRMEDKIDDILIEGCFYDALDDFLGDLVATPAGFIKGPVIRKESRLAWVQDAKGKWQPSVANELTPMFYSPSGLDMYPAPDSKAIDDGYLFEKIPLRRSSIAKMRGVPGYSTERIDAALDEYGRNGTELFGVSEQERKDLEGSRNWQNTPDRTIDALEFHGTVQGKWLREWGMSKREVPDELAEYDITALRIGRFTVRVVLNDDPLHRRPYEKASYDRIKGAFWGKSLPRIIRDIQAMCDACARALSNNMGLASGPFIEAEMDRMADGEDPTSIYPWRVFQTKSATIAGQGPAIKVHSVSNIIEPLMRVYGYFSGLADQYSGIPSYEQGTNPMTGAASTASGLSMLMGAASRQVKRIVAGIDKIITGMVQRTHTYIMLYTDDDEVKGDADIQARGVASLMVKEQQAVRRMEFMQMTANPIDAPIMGPQGRLALLREAAKTLDIDVDKVLPNEDQMRMQHMQAALAAATGGGMGMPGAPPAPGLPPGGPQQPAALLPGGMPAGGQDASLA